MTGVRKSDVFAQVCKNILALQSDAIDFHTAQFFEARRSTDLAQDVERVAIQLQKSPRQELEIPISRIVALRQRITRRNIDPTDFMPQPVDSILVVLEIRNAVSDVIFAIEDARERVWK